MSLTSRPHTARLFAARARRRRVRRLLLSLSVVLAVGAIATLVWMVAWSSVFAVRDVSVRGASGELADDVRDAADAPFGTPLVRVDTGAVAERVAALPAVADVDVGRSWPGTLVIDVAPRTAVATIADGETWWKVDESGVVFGETDSRPEGLPALRVSVDTTPEAEAVRAAGITVLTGLPPAVRDLVTSVEARSEADIRLTLEAGPTVLWGTADDVEKKAEVLLALIDAQDEPPSVYNVSAPDHPAVTP